ncbi:MAG: DUF3343 domain-containing protein [Syntrophomonadaceae bacterium]|nr:DUF3343 domain-containing protein [Syntrophomonadaceae bacterium]
MPKSLFKLKDYAIFTFKSTTQALKAERVLKNASAEFLMVPTPRKISTSCGLAVKAGLDQLQPLNEILGSNGVEIDGVYRMNTIDGKLYSERI